MALLPLKCWKWCGNNGIDWLVRDVMVLNGWGSASCGIHRALHKVYSAQTLQKKRSKLLGIMKNMCKFITTLIDLSLSLIIVLEKLCFTNLQKCVPQKYNWLANLRSQTYKQKHTYINSLCDTTKLHNKKTELYDQLSPFIITS